jgi:hypothetical protein
MSWRKWRKWRKWMGADGVQKSEDLKIAFLIAG